MSCKNRSFKRTPRVEKCWEPLSYTVNIFLVIIKTYSVTIINTLQDSIVVNPTI